MKNVRESDKLLSGGEKAVRREDYEAIPGEREDSGQDQKGSGEREDSRQDLEIVWKSDTQEENGINYQFFEYKRK